jgi:raffinose/stachyose/melibiose transport system permease protein
VTVLQNAVGLGLAMLMNRKGRSYTIYRALIFMPQIFSVAVIGAVFSLILDPFSGPAEKILHGATGQTSAFLGSSSWALPLVMFVNVWMFSGYSMLIYIAGLRNIPTTVYEAAAMDGAGRWRVFRHVTWPLLAPATTVNVFLTAMGTLGEYALILVLTGGNFGTKTLGLSMFSSAFGGNSQLGYGSMLAMLQFILTLVIGGGLLFGLRRREIQL